MWDHRFLDLAATVATWSKDPSTQCGAVIVEPQSRRVVSLGFNGFPQGVADDWRLHDRAQKLPRIIHAEVNAILFARESLRGYWLYTWPFQPCSACAAIVIQAGIRRVVAPVAAAEALARWGDSFEVAKDLFREAGVELCD